MLHPYLKAASAYLKRISPAVADRVELLELDGPRLVSRQLANARTGRDQAISRNVVDNVAPALALLAGIPRGEASAILAELPIDERQEWMARLPLTQAQAFGVAEGSEQVPGWWVSATAPGTDFALAVFAPANTSEEEAFAIGRDLTEAARFVTGSPSSAMSVASLKRPDGPVSFGLQCVHDAHALLGEGPVWNPNTRTLEWVDVLRRTLWTHDPLSGTNRSLAVSRLVTAVLPARDGGRLVLGVGGLSRVDANSRQLVELYDPEGERTTHRLNDAKCDTRGRIWGGTMRLDASAADGSLFRFDSISSSRRIDTGFLVANGLGWSPEDRTMYFTDTGINTIFAYDFDAVSGELSRRRRFIEVPPSMGRPDGLTVDSAGYLWVTMWDGWRVARYDPNGRLDREIILPVPRPTSCCFGGDDLSTLYITSARVRLSRDVISGAPLSGALFSIPLETPGLPTNLARG